MSDDYLWDKSGKPDPEVAALERALAPLRYQEKAPAPEAANTGHEGGDPPIPAPTPRSLSPEKPASPRERRPRVTLVAVSFTAVLAVAAAVLFFYWSRPRPVAPEARAPELAAPQTSSQNPELAASVPGSPPESPFHDPGAKWDVTRVAGVPLCNSLPVENLAQLQVGQWLETDAASRASIAVATIGTVRVDPGSRVRLTATSPTEHRLELARGRIEAEVDAPPRFFQVLTPAATAVDLGCAYSLEVDESGAGVLAVTSGYVSLEWKKRASLVPAGAHCRMKRDHGPGTPSFTDARPALERALRDFDFAAAGEPAVLIALREARPRDSLTLWHLLFRVDEPLRRPVYERLRDLVPPPPGVVEADALTLNRERLRPWKEKIRKTW